MSFELTQADFRVKVDARAVFIFLTLPHAALLIFRSAIFLSIPLRALRLCARLVAFMCIRGSFLLSCHSCISWFTRALIVEISMHLLCVPILSYVLLCISMRFYALSMPFLYNVLLAFARKNRHISAKTRLTTNRESKNCEIASQPFPCILHPSSFRLHPSAFPLLLLK
jgi:hypothetical protein